MLPKEVNYVSHYFKDRAETGRLLAKQLYKYANCPDAMVMALPRGGVPVAFEIAKALNAPLDVCLVSKLRVPGQDELAFGAISLGGIRYINQNIVDTFNISPSAIDAIVSLEMPELKRRNQLYRGQRPPAEVKDKTIILVDDGVATGATMMAAIQTIRQGNPEYLIVATPITAPATNKQLQVFANEVICLHIPEVLYSIGFWYADFTQVSDTEVRELTDLFPQCSR